MKAAADDIVCPCLEVQQPIGTFYVCTMTAADVLAISYADVRRIEDRDIERVVGIQRELSPTRVREIREYVQGPDATFPSSIILAIEGTHARFDPKGSKLRVTREPSVAKIIDGQHRIDGLAGFTEVFDLIVTIFIDMDLEDQAMTFATINLTHTKVNKSLAYDLYEYQKSRSPQKTCHQIARVLNREAKSPLAKRIKILGKATGEELEFLTQATFVSSLLMYISDDPMRDRNALKAGESLPEVSDSASNRLVFRTLFANAQDAKIAKIVWNYFDAVASRWPTAWTSASRGDVLNRRTGFVALMRFLGPVYRKCSDAGGRLSVEAALSVLKKVRLKDSDLSVDRYAPGSSGEADLFRDLRLQSGLE